MIKKYDVAIVGGGIAGASLLYVLARYTNIGHIVLVEKNDSFGSVNTHPHMNSQTLHTGDIETNYTIEKSKSVKEATDLLITYLEKYVSHDAYDKNSKMVIGVGTKEVSELEDRFREFSLLYPYLQKIDKEGIAKIEPNILNERDMDEEIIALSTIGYTVDFQQVAQSLIQEALKTGKVSIEKNSEIIDIEGEKGNFYLSMTQGEVRAKTVAVMTGPHSLLFAKQMGYGKHLGLLPVAGNFYFSKKKNVLNGKVYTVQNKKLPFAAVHGDNEIHDKGVIRFGPTAKVLPMLERGNYESVLEFLKTSVWSLKGIWSLLRIISDRTLFLFVLKNMLYDLPVVGKYFFLQQVRKIVPSMKYSDIYFAKGMGGIRPQIVNTETGNLEMGEAEIVGNGIIFNITPSPGASVCLKNAHIDAERLVSFLGDSFVFNIDEWNEEFKKENVLV